jgi:hypothetical protein
MTICFYVGSFCQALLTIFFKSPLGHEIVVSRLGWLVPFDRRWQTPFKLLSVLTFGQITSCCMRWGCAEGNLIMKRPFSQNGDLKGTQQLDGQLRQPKHFHHVALSFKLSAGPLQGPPHTPGSATDR